MKNLKKRISRKALSLKTRFGNIRKICIDWKNLEHCRGKPDYAAIVQLLPTNTAIKKLNYTNQKLRNLEPKTSK